MCSLFLNVKGWFGYDILKDLRQKVPHV